MNRQRGGVPIPSYRRITRVHDPALRGYVPALSQPTENANQTINKIAGLLNRAGSNPRNPVLSGLGARVEFRIDERDRLLAVYAYLDRSSKGPNLINAVSTLGDGIYALDYVIGAEIVAGTPVTGARQNFIRIVTKAGAVEKTMWAKTYEHDVVNVNGFNALDEVTLLPIEIVAQMIDATRPWLDCTIDFMVSWADEFQVLHNRNAIDKEIGNAKAYGGSKFVSLFQTGSLEGVGVEVNPKTQIVIDTIHTLQVQNTVGLKHVTARFRSKQNSAFYVDVPVLVRVVAPDPSTCPTQPSEPCVDIYLRMGTPLPVETPGIPSVVGVPTVAGTPGSPVAQDLLVITIRGATITAAPKLRVRRWAWVAVSEALTGARLTQIGLDADYTPLVLAGSSPNPGPPYSGPKRYTIALSRSQLANDNVALINVTLLDGGHPSDPVLVAGPSARAIQFFPTGGLGGGPICAY
jgi:hypothetical protein